MALNQTEIRTSPLDREEQERLTMQARIEAFFKQSGGPNNPQIKKVLERHLLFAKDHGPPGKKETIEDAFIDTIIKDPSNLVIMQWLQRVRMARQRRANEHAGASSQEVQRLEAEIQALRKELAELKDVLRQLSACAGVDAKQEA
jgi:hypothetical protein